MTEVIIDILDHLNKQGVLVDEQKAIFALECALDPYNFTRKSTELAIASDLQQRVKYFLASKKIEGCSEGTLKNYFYILRDFDTICNKSLAQITQLDIKFYIVEKSKTRESVEALINCVRSFFSWCHEEQIIISNPASRIFPPKVKKYIRDALSIEQVELCRNACQTARERAIFEFLLATGCRVSEAVELNHEDVLSGRFKVVGKGGKERYIFTNSRAKLYIRQYLKDRNRSSDKLFISSKEPFNSIHEKTLQMELSNVGIRCGVHLYPHVLRHTFATRALENGASLSVVQRWLGHSSASTTEIYAKNSAETISNEYKRCVDF